MKEKLFVLLRSLFVTAVISALIGGVVKFFGYSFFLWFELSFICQFLISYISNTIIEYNALKDIRQIQLKEAEILAQNTMRVSCTSCKKESDVIVRTNQENRFICGFCNTKNAIYLIAETAAVTDPIYEAPTLNTITPNGNQ
jgi:ABC-type transport system involved in multi-copper enzyme maturation permease subunit